MAEGSGAAEVAAAMAVYVGVVEVGGEAGKAGFAPGAAVGAAEEVSGDTSPVFR